MNRDKLIAILLFLLLLLIILCTWFHSENIAKNRVISPTDITNVTQTEVPSKSIDFNLKKDKDSFELLGNFSNMKNVEKLQAALGTNEVNNLSTIDNNRVEQTDVIALCEQLIPIFKNKYINGSINYTNNKITIEGVVEDSADKDAISTLLANSVISSVNNTKVIFIPKNPIKFKIDKLNDLLAIQGVFNTSSDAEELIKSLDNDNLKKHIELDAKLIPSEKVLALTKQLIQPFKSNYKEGFIKYENKTLTIDGTVDDKAAKAEIEALLKLGGINYINNTKVTNSQTTAEEEATRDQAQKEVIEIEAEIKKVIDLENINFELNKAALTEKSLSTISHISSILQDHPTVNVEIAGHTDNSGDDTYNLNLSQSRVDTVKKQLIKMEIDASRLKAVGYGETQPLVSNDTEENRRLNRRVEFKIIGE